MRRPYHGNGAPMNFDPNESNKQRPRWATYVPSRRGATFRTYANVGHAKLSISSRGILYEFDQGRWVEHFRVDPHDPAHREELKCWECGYEPADDRDYAYDLKRKWVFAPRGVGAFWKRLVLCDHCATFIR